MRWANEIYIAVDNLTDLPVISLCYCRGVRQFSSFISRIDTRFLVLVLILLGFGLTILYSASSVLATDKFQDSLYFLKRQAFFALIGFILMTWVASSSSRAWLSFSFYFLIISLFFLLLTYVPAFSLETKGAARWIRIFSFQFQPVELLKLAWVLFLSHYLPLEKSSSERSFYEKPLTVIVLWLLSVVATLYQPDFGNAFLLCLITFGLLFLSGLSLKLMLSVGFLGAVSAVIVVFQEDYRRRRLLSFLDPWSDPQNASYQIIQSFTAFHSGGWWGKGLGNSQEKLYFLPEVHTDFIGSIVAEELGFFGFSLLLFLFFLFCQSGFRISKNALRNETYLLASGITLMFSAQILFNLFVILGLLPTKGIPLPFLSHGGSSLMASMVMVGFLMLVAKESRYHA